MQNLPTSWSSQDTFSRTRVLSLSKTPTFSSSIMACNIEPQWRSVLVLMLNGMKDLDWNHWKSQMNSFFRRFQAISLPIALLGSLAYSNWAILDLAWRNLRWRCGIRTGRREERSRSILRCEIMRLLRKKILLVILRQRKRTRSPMQRQLKWKPKWSEDKAEETSSRCWKKKDKKSHPTDLVSVLKLAFSARRRGKRPRRLPELSKSNRSSSSSKRKLRLLTPEQLLVEVAILSKTCLKSNKQKYNAIPTKILTASNNSNLKIRKRLRFFRRF